MLTIYDLNQQKMLDKPDFFSLLDGYDSFKGSPLLAALRLSTKNCYPGSNRLI